uniref:Uncharacterized protein n=1 Tax=Anguilla anguilla TaxID=7936 RepID=A0A0E9QJA2_ANGAN
MTQLTQNNSHNVPGMFCQCYKFATASQQYCENVSAGKSFPMKNVKQIAPHH